MLNKLIKHLFHKEIILYNRHRQTIPIVVNPGNRSAYYFFETQFLWKMIPFSGKNQWKYRIMNQVLNFIGPKFILDINWIGKSHSLYYLWCKRHPESKFVVVQHGVYAGGIVTDIPHRFTKCQVFLCWSEYFIEVFRNFNRSKKVILANFGNTIYNKTDRTKFEYPATTGNRILLVPSAIGGERLRQLIAFKDKLVALGFSVDLKEHNFQTRIYEEIKGIHKIGGDIYEILSQKEYDIVISDHSSSLLDAVFFKNNTLFFSPEGEIIECSRNLYNDYLVNVALDFEKLSSREELFALVNTGALEKLFDYMVNAGNNELRQIK
jgi:hypothetical protein